MVLPLLVSCVPRCRPRRPLQALGAQIPRPPLLVHPRPLGQQQTVSNGPFVHVPAKMGPSRDAPQPVLATHHATATAASALGAGTLRGVDPAPRMVSALARPRRLLPQACSIAI